MAEFNLSNSSHFFASRPQRSKSKDLYGFRTRASGALFGLARLALCICRALRNEGGPAVLAAELDLQDSLHLGQNGLKKRRHIQSLFSRFSQGDQGPIFGLFFPLKMLGKIGIFCGQCFEKSLSLEIPRNIPQNLIFRGHNRAKNRLQIFL
jgi:hypothetical protein